MASRSFRRYTLCAFCIALPLLLPALVRAAEPDPSLCPRRLGEIKAMIQVLAPEKRSAADAEDAYIRRLKQYRYICGVPFEELYWDETCADLARHASLVCSKLDKLTHTPEKPAGMDDQAYAKGKKGAGESNLFMGRTSPIPCVDGWMDDSDPKNIGAVGHRRWCLGLSLLKTGFGATGKYAAMHVFDRSRKTVPDWDFVAFPARGYMPIELFGSRYAWHATLNPAKYENPDKDAKAVIQPVDDKLKPQGSPLNLDHFSIGGPGCGSGPAVIFRPGPEPIALSSEGRFMVEITGLKTKSKQSATIKYLVHFVDLKKAPDSSDGRGVYTAYFKQRIDAAKSMPQKLDQLDALSEIAEDKYLSVADPAVAKDVRTCLSDLLKDSALRKEQEANQRYKAVAEMEQKSARNKSQLTQVAVAYRDLSVLYKETRAGRRAGDDFERLKKDLQL